LCVALYGCSSSVQQSGGISGADTAAPSGAVSSSAAAAPSASLAPVAGLSMTFHIPADLTLEFQPADQGSSTANQVQTIVAYQYESFIEALSTSGQTKANYVYLTAGGALAAENTELAWWKKQNERLTGTDRLYAFTVKLSGSEQAVYSFCEDSTRLAYRNLASGATIQNTADTTDNYTLRQGTLAKGKGDLWTVQTMSTRDGAASCIGN
jgi:hypothetical protein